MTAVGGPLEAVRERACRNPGRRRIMPVRKFGRCDGEAGPQLERSSPLPTQPIFASPAAEAQLKRWGGYARS
jgi:hypothetical protein